MTFSNLQFVAIVFSHCNYLFGKCSREKIRPVRELQRAESQILRSKLAIREAVHELDDMGLEGSLDDLFDAEGRIYHEEVYVIMQTSCGHCPVPLHTGHDPSHIYVI